MLLAKIDPKASFVQSTGPFTPPVTMEAEYFTALARPYVPGAAKTNFEVMFGNAVKKDDKTDFTRVSSINVTLTAEELVDWGTDDSALLTAIAENIGTTITEFVTITENMF